MTTHSTSHFGGNGQHPSVSSYYVNGNIDQTPMKVGLEWNVRDSQGQIDLTWWLNWYDEGSNSWKSEHTTQVILRNANHDYYDFYNSFNGAGFFLIINLAQGGEFPQVFDKNQCLQGGNQYVRVKSAKVYGF